MQILVSLAFWFVQCFCILWSRFLLGGLWNEMSFGNLDSTVLAGSDRHFPETRRSLSIACRVPTRSWSMNFAFSANNSLKTIGFFMFLSTCLRNLRLVRNETCIFTGSFEDSSPLHFTIKQARPVINDLLPVWISKSICFWVNTLEQHRKCQKPSNGTISLGTDCTVSMSSILSACTVCVHLVYQACWFNKRKIMKLKWICWNCLKMCKFFQLLSEFKLKARFSSVLCLVWVYCTSCLLTCCLHNVFVFCAYD